MKKFILKTSIFTFPFVIFFSLNVFFYDQKEGDLIRLGYLYSNPTPKSMITSQYNLHKHYTLLSEIDITSKKKFKIVTIGDSFSEQGNLGYKNFIGNNGVSVLHIDRFISGNPIQTLIQLLNSDLFDYVSTDYILLQSVERVLIQRIHEIDFNISIDLDGLSNDIKNQKREVPDDSLQFFSAPTIKAPITNILYSFDHKPFTSKTYKYKSINTNLFSNNPDDLLFYQDDIININSKNDKTSILKCIQALENVNELAAKKNIKLIVLISPDKYDIYYPFIKNNNKLTKPLFFSIYEPLEKEYINIESFKILTEEIKKERDIYFYDDTHWSPKGAEIIAEEIYNIISE